jgi:hypothetical protein
MATMEDKRYISVQIAPGDITVTAGLSGAFAIASAKRAADTVYVDYAVEGHVTDHPATWRRSAPVLKSSVPRPCPQGRASTSWRR